MIKINLTISAIKYNAINQATHILTKINMPGNKKPEPRSDLPCPTILRPNKNSAVAEKDEPKTRNTLAIISGKPLGKTNANPTPSMVMSSIGLKKSDLTMLKNTIYFSLKQRVCLAICSAGHVSGQSGGFNACWFEKRKQKYVHL